MHSRRRVIDSALRGDYESDAVFRERFQAWINAPWAEKDADVAVCLAVDVQRPQMSVTSVR